MEPSKNKIPVHIGIVPDGSRRFAKRLMLKAHKGHEWGAKKIEKLLDWCREFNVKELTIYAFSIENFDRPKKEFDFLMNIFRKEFTDLLTDKRIDENKTKVNFIGRIYMFPKDLQELMEKNMQRSKSYNNFIINFAMAYGGRAEIIDATKKIAEQIKSGSLNVDDINEEVFKKNLYLESEPDLIIRTSESRLSGFLIWQGAYAEIEFLPDKLWPEFKKEDFIKCLQDYSKRERRFGK